MDKDNKKNNKDKIIQPINLSFKDALEKIINTKVDNKKVEIKGNKKEEKPQK